MFVTVINDCTDFNVRGRIGTRVAGLFGVAPTYVGVGGKLSANNHADPAEYEAAGCLVDVLDTAEGKGVVLVNVANRHAKGKRWPNGTPFGYFWVQNVLVVSTIDGYSLSLIKKLHLASEIRVFDIPTVMQELARRNVVEEQLAEQIIHTQFRSLEFEPRAAKWLADKIDLPSTVYPLSEIETMPPAVWYIDNFGNCKTTLLPEDIDFAKGKVVQTRFGDVPCFARLKDVPNGHIAFIIGSSGYGDKRFLELVMQGVSVAKKKQLTVGSLLFIKNTS